MSALVRHRVSLFGKTSVSMWFILLFSVTPLLWPHDMIRCCQTDQIALVSNASRGESCLSRRNWRLGNCELPAHSGAVPGCKVQYQCGLFDQDVKSLYCCCRHLSFYGSFRTVMKSGPEIVKAGLRSFFESAADDIEKMVENLKLGKVSKGNQVIQGHCGKWEYNDKSASWQVLIVIFQGAPSAFMACFSFPSKWKVCPRTSTTPPSPSSQSSPPYLITSLSISLEMMSSVSCLFRFLVPHVPLSTLTRCCFLYAVDDLQMSCYRIMCSIYSLGTVKNPHVER